MQRLRIFLRRTYGGLPGITWLICGAAFVNRAGAMVLPFLSLYLGRRFDYRIAEAGSVVALYGVGLIVGSLLGGRLADRLGPVRLQILTLSAACLWMWMLPLIGNVGWFAAGLFVLGVFNDAFRPGNVASVAASCAPYRQAKALTLNRLALNAGWAIGPAIGGMLAKHSYAWLFVVDGLTCGLAALLLLLCVPKGLGARRPAAADGAPLRHSPLRDRRFALLLLLSALCFMTFLQHFQTLSRHLKEVLHLDEGDIGRLLVINPALIVLFEMPLVHRLRSRARLRVIAAGALAVGLAFPWLIAQSAGVLAVLPSILTLTVGEMLFMPFLGAHVSETAPEAARGRYLGAYFATFSIGFVLAPAVGGWVYEHCGADALWLGCLAAGSLVAAGFLWLDRSGRAARGITPRP
jgi:predicted MFS family arabinose efflux permease